MEIGILGIVGMFGNEPKGNGGMVTLGTAGMVGRGGSWLLGKFGNAPVGKFGMEGNDGIEGMAGIVGWEVCKRCRAASPTWMLEKDNAIINDRTKQKLELAAIDRLMLKVENFTRFAPMRKFLIDVASWMRHTIRYLYL